MGGGPFGGLMVMDSIGVNCVRSNADFNFKNKFEDPDANDGLYKDKNHVCSYYEINDFQTEFSHESCKFSTLSYNIRSLPGKWNEFKNFIGSVNHNKFKFSVVAVQEVWNVPVGINYLLEGYKPFEYKIRNPSGRDGNAGGGVGIWVDNNLEYEVLEELSVFEPHFFESLFVKIKTGRNKFTIIGNVYRPNTGPLADLNGFLNKLSDILDKIRNDPEFNKCEDVQLMGDYNLDLLQYSSHNLTGQYVDILLGNGLLPIITQPTRVFGRSATIIDHVSTSHKSNQYKAGILLSCISDHFPIFYTRDSITIRPNNRNHSVRKINTETTLAFASLLESATWETILTENRPEHAYRLFYEHVDNSFDLAFPISQVKNNVNRIPLSPWMTQGLLQSRKHKDKLGTKKLKNPTDNNIRNYKVYNSLYNKIIRVAKIKYYENEFQKVSKDIKRTWDVTREALGTRKIKAEIPNYFKVDMQNIEGSKAIADGFNDFFSSIANELANKITVATKHFTEFLGERVVNNFVFAPVTPPLLQDIVNKLKPKKSTGTDNISTKLLKEILPIITIPLCHIYNLSLQTGFIPNRFKIAKVIPVYKSGDKHLYTNYRPISLLSSFSKVLEKIVAKQMYAFLYSNSILYNHQYGFRRGHSTSHVLIHFLNKIHEALNKNVPEYTLGIFLDLKKAFDTVDHSILLRKLDHYGFRGVSNSWLRNYLTGRFQYVHINGTNSERREIKFGVPQGSVLGPLLFLIFINDLANASSLLAFLFADDTTLLLSSNDVTNLFLLANEQLKKISLWFHSNRLTLNITKTRYAVFRSKNMHLPCNLALSIGNEKISRIGVDGSEQCFKFVGHIIDEHLSWTYHIRHVQNKISSGNYLLARAKNLLPRNILLNIYNCLVRPHLEYGILSWGGVGISKLKGLLTTQKKAIRNVAGKPSNSHTNPLFTMLNSLKFKDLFTLNSAIFMYKFKNNILPRSFQNMFTPCNAPNRTNSFKVIKSRISFLDQFPNAYLPKTWNELSGHLKESATLSLFSKKLKETLLWQNN